MGCNCYLFMLWLCTVVKGNTYMCFCRPAVLSSQSWPLQSQSQVLTAVQPTFTSGVSMQLSRSHDSVMQSTVPRPLTFSQQIRPQQPQLAVVTQKPVLSSITRSAGHTLNVLCLLKASHCCAVMMVHFWICC